MKPPKYSPIKVRITTALLLVLIALIVAVPVLANSSSWSFFLPDNAYAVDGKANGRIHTMTAGTLTFSGSFYVSRVIPAAGNPSPVKFTVYKLGSGLFDPDRVICSTTITPSKMVGSAYAKSFSKNCGTIAAGKYYIYILRTLSAADGYELVGSGTLRTP